MLLSAASAAALLLSSVPSPAWLPEDSAGTDRARPDIAGRHPAAEEDGAFLARGDLEVRVLDDEWSRDDAARR